jgi:hypothetical protein
VGDDCPINTGPGLGALIDRTMERWRRTRPNPQVKTDHAKVAASNEALSLEFGTQPLQMPTEPPKPKPSAARPPPPPPSAPASSAAAAAAAADAQKRSAAEALAGLVAPASAATAAQGGEAAAAAAAAASADPLSDYHRMKAKSNRLTPQDDERIRLFYLHGAQGNPHPEQREVKIKINEDEVLKEDGSRVRETLYLTLNYDSRKAVLVRRLLFRLFIGPGHNDIHWSSISSLRGCDSISRMHTHTHIRTHEHERTHTQSRKVSKPKTAT